MTKRAREGPVDKKHASDACALADLMGGVGKSLADATSQPSQPRLHLELALRLTPSDTATEAPGSAALSPGSSCRDVSMQTQRDMSSEEAMAERRVRRITLTEGSGGGDVIQGSEDSPGVGEGGKAAVQGAADQHQTAGKTAMWREESVGNSCRAPGPGDKSPGGANCEDVSALTSRGSLGGSGSFDVDSSRALEGALEKVTGGEGATVGGLQGQPKVVLEEATSPASRADKGTDGPGPFPGRPQEQACRSASNREWPLDVCPTHGALSVCGRRPDMEDAVTIAAGFVRVPCGSPLGCQLDELPEGLPEPSPSPSPSPAGSGGGGEALCRAHFFGVYDGHGGAQVANFCAAHLHEVLAEEAQLAFAAAAAAHPPPQAAPQADAIWRAAIGEAFQRIDMEVGGQCTAGGAHVCRRGAQCRHEPVAAEAVGSTAVVAVVSARHIVIGNCGDSRAVLSQAGKCVPLSQDHKPDREDEMKRVEDAGGRVIFWDGYRIFGVLAMSRAIGDRYLKPYVIAEPEVSCMLRTPQDECLILATDGLWDVITNEVACDIARKCLERKSLRIKGGKVVSSERKSDDSPTAMAAAMLVKLALARGSGDNISVVVVDLKRGGLSSASTSSDQLHSPSPPLDSPSAPSSAPPAGPGPPALLAPGPSVPSASSS